MSDRRNPFEKSAALVTKALGARTLETLRAQAEGETSGCAFDAVRVLNGPRLVIVVCFTRPDQIERVRRLFDFGDAGPDGDWSSVALVDLVLRIGLGAGRGFEAKLAADGTWSALAVIAAEPLSITRIEALLGLRP